MANITYQPEEIIKVFLNNKQVGIIERDNYEARWRYLPQGRKKFAGEWYNNLNELKRSLEAE